MSDAPIAQTLRVLKMASDTATLANECETEATRVLCGKGTDAAIGIVEMAARALGILSQERLAHVLSDLGCLDGDNIAQCTDLVRDERSVEVLS